MTIHGDLLPPLLPLITFMRISWSSCLSNRFKFVRVCSPRVLERVSLARAGIDVSFRSISLSLSFGLCGSACVVCFRFEKI